MIRNAEVLELAQQLVRDQQEWLDKTMREILPESEYLKITRQNVTEPDIKRFLERNQVCIHFHRNSPLIRISRYGRIVAEFVPQITIDGRPIDIGKIIDKDGRAPWDIWADSN